MHGVKGFRAFDQTFCTEAGFGVRSHQIHEKNRAGYVCEGFHQRPWVAGTDLDLLKLMGRYEDARRQINDIQAGADGVNLTQASLTRELLFLLNDEEATLDLQIQM